MARPKNKLTDKLCRKRLDKYFDKQHSDKPKSWHDNVEWCVDRGTDHNYMWKYKVKKTMFKLIINRNTGIIYTIYQSNWDGEWMFLSKG